MKNILLISYHALPLDVVASYRTKSYCDYLLDHDIYPTLITHRWEKDAVGNYINHDDNAEVIYEEYTTHKVIRLPRPFESMKSKSSFQTLKNWLRGDFDLHLLNSYITFKYFLFNHLKISKYDAVLAIFSPHYHLKLAYEIYKEFGIPYVLDFRDLWDNQVIVGGKRCSFKKRIQDGLVRIFWRKWLKNSLFFSATSVKWIEYLENLSGIRGIKIRNGHELQKIPKVNFTEKFRLAYFGKIYPYQNLDVIIDGINRFLDTEKPSDDFEVLLIGIKKADRFNGAQVLKQKINSKNLFEVHYMPKEQLMKFALENVSVFILPNLYEDNGSFFVKLYDYIALNKPVILAPENGSENDQIITNLRAGLITSSAQEVANFIKKSYQEYVVSGKVESEIDINSIQYYHRSYQVNILAYEIKKRLN